MSPTTGRPAPVATAAVAPPDRTERSITRRVLPSGLRLLIDPMPGVRSVSLGVWLARGSRHEDPAQGGIAHFVEHMLFKGTATRTAEQFAQEVDSIGGNLDAYTSHESAGYDILTLDEHVPHAVDLLSDLLLHPVFPEQEIVRERNVVLEEINQVEDTPGDLAYELLTAGLFPGHPLGRSILGTAATVSAFDGAALNGYFGRAYRAENLIVAAAGNVDPDHLGALVGEAFAAVPTGCEPVEDVEPRTGVRLDVRDKGLEQVQVCLGTRGYPQRHPDRYALALLIDMLGGPTSSRLFQQIREQRGLAYSVGSGMIAYRDAGLVTIHAGCGQPSVGEVVDLIVAALRAFKNTPPPEDELQRAKDHVKSNLLLGFESPGGRMAELAHAEMYYDRHMTVTEALANYAAVTAGDVQRVANDLFRNGALGGALVGPVAEPIEPSRLDLG
ncbi:MAG: insulinase family protein [Acidobacteria bacterium]|nr:insulinase family protein [Acidobacteriota bacterium]